MKYELFGSMIYIVCIMRKSVFNSIFECVCLQMEKDLNNSKVPKYYANHICC